MNYKNETRTRVKRTSWGLGKLMQTTLAGEVNYWMLSPPVAMIIISFHEHFRQNPHTR